MCSDALKWLDNPLITHCAKLISTVLVVWICQYESFVSIKKIC